MAQNTSSPLVLVAEDHPTNQLVARRQLALLGISCEVVEDGIGTHVEPNVWVLHRV